MENYKIKVNDEAESKEVISLLVQLGYFKQQPQSHNFNFYIYANSNGTLSFGDKLNTFKSNKGREPTLPQLRDLVVLHRNDVKDANYLYGQRLVLKLETQDYKIWDLNKLEWVDHVGSQTDLRNGITRIQLSHTKEQGLISGADALRALAEGKQVDACVTLRPNTEEWHWFDAKNLTVNEIEGEETEGMPDGSDVRKIVFRLKPRTITLSLEIPAPFEPKVGEEVFYINDTNKSGYCVDEHQAHYNYNFGAWRTEEEIKQVVAALRGIKG